MSDMLVLWRMIKPGVQGAHYVCGVARDDDGLVLLLEGRGNARSPVGTYDDESSLTADGVMRASELWRTVFRDAGWIDATT